MGTQQHSQFHTWPRHWQRARPIYENLCRYHDYQVIGLEHIPTQGPAIIAMSHSLATYDTFLLGGTVYYERNRQLHGLGDRLIFKVAGLREAAGLFGIVEGNHQEARTLLTQSHLVGVAPGGMMEALRSSAERYQLRWQTRTGFVRLAIECQTPIVLAACPRADDLYTIAPSRLTRFVYDTFKFPLPIAWGVGYSVLPRPIPLLHYLSEPLVPPRLADPKDIDQAVSEFHRKVVARMQLLMEQALEHGR